MLTLHTLQPAKGSRSKSFRVGRGNASGRGTTAGKGTKGQRARTGGRNKLKLKGLRAMMLSFPKLRGFQSRFEKPASVTLARVATAFGATELVTLKSLKEKNLIPKSSKAAKIVGGGAIDHVLNTKEILVTASVKALIEKAGGKVK